MSFRARMYNRRAAHPKSMPDKILEKLPLKPGHIVADVGAGGGYFSLKFAEMVGSGGRVYALDVNRKFLDFIKANAMGAGLNNVECIYSPEDVSLLPEKKVDMIFLRNVYHHIKNPADYLASFTASLKPDGKLVIVENKKVGGLSLHSMFGHHTPKEQIHKEMKSAGYELKEDHDFLPEQSFMIFSVKGEETKPKEQEAQAAAVPEAPKAVVVVEEKASPAIPAAAPQAEAKEKTV